jgi:hypothetical protein
MRLVHEQCSHPIPLIMPTTIETFLRRSNELELALQAEFPEAELLLADPTPKCELVAVAAMLALEHGLVLRTAFEVGAPNSGAALLRLQYEALLRAVWLLFAATPKQVDKLTRTLDLAAEQAAKGLPGYLEMLTAVQKNGPVGLTRPLVEFNQSSRHALNSFVHTGIHSLSRGKDGFPAEVAEKILRFSNGLAHLAYRLLASLTGQQLRMDQVTALYLAFADCLPMSRGHEKSSA